VTNLSPFFQGSGPCTCGRCDGVWSFKDGALTLVGGYSERPTASFVLPPEVRLCTAWHEPVPEAADLLMLPTGVEFQWHDYAASPARCLSLTQRAGSLVARILPLDGSRKAPVEVVMHGIIACRLHSATFSGVPRALQNGA